MNRFGLIDAIHISVEYLHTYSCQIVNCQLLNCVPMNKSNSYQLLGLGIELSRIHKKLILQRKVVEKFVPEKIQHRLTLFKVQIELLCLAPSSGDGLFIPYR